jgi:putative Holliday junction resolvase
MQANNTILALDVGTKRIGVARGLRDVRIASPLMTLANDDQLWTHLTRLIAADSVQTLVIGLPRGLSGQETEQTTYVRTFVDHLKRHIDAVTIHLQDEALTSTKAEAELNARGKQYEKGEIDALAATYILEDFLNSAGLQHV